ncbi:MAG: hypothetical protein CLLPBCKN_000362 [Chroococcidiopsis cubana SAG 39.79]|nr:hypothetical protein [Chroococcidiopsis cubana SAG 39.79]
MQLHEFLPLEQIRAAQPPKPRLLPNPFFCYALPENVARDAPTIALQLQ